MVIGGLLPVLFFFFFKEGRVAIGPRENTC